MNLVINPRETGFLSLDLQREFGNSNPVILEIGSGKGRFLISSATEQPDRNFIGIEKSLHYHRVIRDRVTKRSLTNVRLINHDAFLVLQKMIPDASIAEKVKPPDPYSGKTARERFTKHQEDPVCRSCHALMDPVGFALENFDAIGLYRTQENGVTIDASGSVPGAEGIASGAPELVQKLATVEGAQSCFAGHWLELAYGKTVGEDDACVQAAVEIAFHKAGYNVRQLLLALTQTDAFLYYTGSQ